MLLGLCYGVVGVSIYDFSLLRLLCYGFEWMDFGFFCCMEVVVVLRLVLMVFPLMFSFFSYSCCVMGLYGLVLVEVVVGVP